MSVDLILEVIAACLAVFVLICWVVLGVIAFVEVIRDFKSRDYVSVVIGLLFVVVHATISLGAITSFVAYNAGGAK